MKRASIYIFSIILIAASKLMGGEAPSGWNELTFWKGLRRIGPDGLWVGRFPIASGDALRDLKMEVGISHKLHRAASGTTRSFWMLNGIQTYVIPREPGVVQWVTPWGPGLDFPIREASGGAIQSKVGNWTLSSDVKDVYVIQSPSGLHFVYQEGSLVQVDHPTRGRFQVESQHGLVRRVTGEEKGEVILDVITASDGRVERIQSGGSSVDLLWSDEGLLKQITRNGTVATTFQYRNNLISLVQDGGSAPLLLEWKANSEYGRPGVNWPAPAHLTSDGQFDYRYDINAEGIVVIVTDRSFGATVRTTINLSSHQVTQVDENGAKHLADMRRVRDKMVFTVTSNSN